mmetsp:Transcript_59270/g.117740  ORF Transcript_59270/g.117740 Transcript_59270/m.117740 type:complete len:82 (-) Transcript_59270:1731-1976(-)
MRTDAECAPRRVLYAAPSLPVHAAFQPYMFVCRLAPPKRSKRLAKLEATGAGAGLAGSGGGGVAIAAVVGGVASHFTSSAA